MRHLKHVPVYAGNIMSPVLKYRMLLGNYSWLSMLSRKAWAVISTAH